MWHPIALLHVGARLSWTTFTVHPSTVIGLMALGALYAWRARAHPEEALGSLRPALFGTSLGLMFLSLNGWLHDLSDSYLFSAHMVQHLVLAMAVAPLMIMGTPGWMLRPLLRVRAFERLGRAASNPLSAFAIFNVVLIGWHLPPLYNAAMEHHDLHIVQHLLLLAASVIMWWPVLSPMPELPRLSYPGQIIYLFVMTIPMSIISAAIAYSDAVLYPFYAAAPRVMRLSPMEDQMIGALIMWIPGGLYLFGVITVIFFKWQRAGAHDSRESAQVGLAPVKT